MFRRKIAFCLVIFLIVNLCNFTTGNNCYATESNVDTYVVMADVEDDLYETIEDIVGYEIPQEDCIGESEEIDLAIVDLSTAEVQELEQEGIIVEENISFDGFTDVLNDEDIHMI